MTNTLKETNQTQPNPTKEMTMTNASNSETFEDVTTDPMFAKVQNAFKSIEESKAKLDIVNVPVTKVKYEVHIKKRAIRKEAILFARNLADAMTDEYFVAKDRYGKDDMVDAWINDDDMWHLGKIVSHGTSWLGWDSDSTHDNFWNFLEQFKDDFTFIDKHDPQKEKYVHSVIDLMDEVLSAIAVPDSD